MKARTQVGPLTEPYISTGHLPAPDDVTRLVDEAYARFQSNTDGENSQIYPALAQVPSELFGICVAGTNGDVYAVGDTQHDFSIMSVSKPFLFALICELIGPDAAKEKLGANSTGLPFNSLAAIERSPDGLTNPMVNAGAIPQRASCPARPKPTNGFSSTMACRALQAALCR